MVSIRITPAQALKRLSESPPDAFEISASRVAGVSLSGPGVPGSSQTQAAAETEVLELTSSDEDMTVLPVQGPVVVKQEEVMNISSSEEDIPIKKRGKGAPAKRGTRSRRGDPEPAPPQQAVDVPPARPVRKTRAANVNKKRALQDAVSSDEELPATISPTKRPKASTAASAAKAELESVRAALAAANAKLAVAKAELAASEAEKAAIEHADTDAMDVSNASAFGGMNTDIAPLAASHVPPDAAEGGLLPAAEINLSLSPLKVGAGKVSVAIPEDDNENPFLSTSIFSLDKGKGKAVEDPYLDPEAVARHFADEADEALRIEDEVMAAALKASRELYRRPNAAFSSSANAIAMPIVNSGVSVPIKVEVEEGRLHPDEVFEMSQALRATEKVPPSQAEEYVDSACIPRTPDKVIPSLYTPAVPGPLNVPQFNVNVARKTFKDVIAPTSVTPMLGNGPVLADYMSFQVPFLPDICGAFSKSSQDPYLANDYLHLPKLKHGVLKGWGDSNDNVNSVWFSKWADQCPQMSFDTALAAVRFNRHNNFVNPSRVSPMDVYVTYTTHDKKKSMLQCNGKPAVCISPILSKDSFLYEPTTTGLKNKYISGHLHHQEYERFACFACTVFDKKTMVTQLQKGAISFSTMGNYKGDRESASPSKPPRNPGILTDVVTPGVKQKPIKSNTYFKTVLNFTDDIPVYDGRRLPFDFNANLDDIADHLPLLGEEIPCNSFVVVGYSMGHYEKDGRAHLATNILFAILVGTEYDE